MERQVPHARRDFFAGEDFIDLADAQRRAVQWCRTTAGMRVHGTTQLHPAEGVRSGGGAGAAGRDALIAMAMLTRGGCCPPDLAGTHPPRQQ